MERKLYEIDPSRLPARVLAAKLIKLEELAAVVRAYTGYRPRAVQRVLDSMPKLNDRGGWEALAADVKTVDADLAAEIDTLLTDEDLMRKDFE